MTPSIRIRNVFCTAVTALACLAAAACGGAPELPPEDTLFFPSFEEGKASGALNEAGATTNVAAAAVSVGAVTIAVNLALLTPRIIFAGTLQAKPNKEGDDWVWKKSFPLLGGTSELHARANGKSVDVEMHVTGQRDNLTHLDDFVWFTGSHNGKSGTWKLFDPGTPTEPGPDTAVVQIDWTRAAADDKTLMFENVRVGDLKNGDSITYALDGTIASMSIHDELSGNNDDGVATDFTVEWNINDGNGIMSKDADSYCWDTLSHGQLNMTCPAGDWP